MYGNDWEYANSRLEGTIVRLGEEPVFVHRVGPEMKAEISTLENIYEPFIVNANELNLVPVPLGMCNFNKDICYLSRVPLRRDWRQGLRRENFISSIGDHGAIPPDVLAAVIKGTYPTFKEAMERIANGEGAVAWNRKWAITKGGHLIYKKDAVGINKDGVLLLNKEFQYLAEALEEAV